MMKCSIHTVTLTMYEKSAQSDCQDLKSLFTLISTFFSHKFILRTAAGMVNESSVRSLAPWLRLV